MIPLKFFSIISLGPVGQFDAIINVLRICASIRTLGNPSKSDERTKASAFLTCG